MTPHEHTEKLYNISPSSQLSFIGHQPGKVEVWQLGDTDCNMFGISMLMLNYRDQSDGEDISFIRINSVGSHPGNTDIFAGEYNRRTRASCDQESYQVIEQ